MLELSLLMKLFRQVVNKYRVRFLRAQVPRHIDGTFFTFNFGDSIPQHFLGDEFFHAFVFTHVCDLICIGSGRPGKITLRHEHSAA